MEDPSTDTIPGIGAVGNTGDEHHFEQGAIKPEITRDQIARAIEVIGSRELDLSARTLEGLDLSKLVLEHADMREANLQRANLQYSNLSWANLVGADLRHADLRGASLNYAKLQVANLCGADLSTARLQNANIKHAKYDAQTRWPPGFAPYLAGADEVK